MTAWSPLAPALPLVLSAAALRVPLPKPIRVPVPVPFVTLPSTLMELAVIPKTSEASAVALAPPLVVVAAAVVLA